MNDQIDTPGQQTVTIKQAIDLAVQHHDAGRLPEAESIYTQILLAEPEHPVALHSLGVIAHQVGKNDIAVDLINRALVIQPDIVEAYIDLGNVLKELNDWVGAIENYQKALAIGPDFFGAHYNIGLTLQEQNRLNEALESYQKALAIEPNFAEAHNDLGNTLKELNRLNEAAACFRRALTINPDFTEAHYNLGNTLRDMGEIDDALVCYDKALTLNSDYIQAYSNRLYALKLKMGITSLEIRSEAEKFGQYARANAKPFSNWSILYTPEKCLRVGIVSGDLRNHVLARFLEPVLSNIDKSRIAFVAYNNSFVEDEMTAKLKAYFALWNRVSGLSDDRLASRIYDDKIDILIDLSGHTSRNRLPVFAYKPAPVQSTWLGLFATSGLREMNYIIADPYIAPHHEADFFTEDVWRLPEAFFCAAPPDIPVEPSTPPMLKNGYVTFGCFNQLAKMNDGVVEVWANILQKVPNSKLLLKNVDGDAMKSGVSARFTAFGVQLDQLILEERSPPAEYYSAFNRVDITLDPFPYTGGMTSLDSLWMGVPVLTHCGERVGSHLGESIAVNAGLADWIAPDNASYISKAISYASDFDKLAKLRANLRNQVLNSPLYDAPRFARHFEVALRGMWYKACDRATQASRNTA